MCVKCNTKKWRGRPVDTGMALVWGDLWVLQKRGGASCYFRETCGYHSRLEGYGVRSGEACVNCQQIIYTVILQFCTKLHCASQEQSHVCLGSHLTKPSLHCMCGYGQTAAIHVTWQHNMRNFLGCKILQGPHPAAWDQEGLPFKLKLS